MNETKKIKKGTLAILVLSAAGVGVLTGCSTVTDDPEGYTYNTYLSTSPSKWNVHNWETSDESYIQSFTEVGLYDVVMNKDHNGYEFISEMASDMPKSVDPEELDVDEYDTISNKYYNGGNVSKGCIWEIPLRETAVWEDGTPIKAVDYVESMERLLQPKYANYRADSYYQGNFVIANAENYYKNGRQILEPVYQYITAGKADGENLYDEEGNVLQSTKDYYIDLAAGDSPYGNSIFSSSGSTDSITFYDVLNNRSTPGSDALELAAKRITLGVKYYYWQFAEKTEDVDKWNEIKKADSVTKDMMAKMKPIQIREFDSKAVMTCKTRSDSDDLEPYSQKDLKNDLRAVVAGLSKSASWASKDWAWKVPLSDYVTHKRAEGLSKENIGVSAEDDYTLRLYLTKAISALDLKFQLSSNWLVKTDLYDSKTIKSGNSWSTSYGSASTANYMSYGPYKLTGFVSGQAITIERNENWYGYSDETYKAQFKDYSEEDQDQYKMTKIYTRIIKTHETAVSEFMAGRLDDIDLNKQDMKKYGNSSRRTTTLESYTQKVSFNTDRSKLYERQKGQSGVNKTILANANFRKGLSLGLDRNTFASQTTAGSQAFTGLLNTLYLANNVTGEVYRNTTQGKSVYNMVYGELGGNPTDEARSALSENANGYNYNWAKYYVKEGLKEELQSTTEGHLQPGDTVTIEFRVYDDQSDTTTEMSNFIETAWKGLIEEAAAELKAEDKTLLGDKNISLKINLQKDEDYYTTARNGGCDMIFSIWGGAAIDPYGLMQVYLDKDFANTCEYGFKGKQGDVNLWIDLDSDGKQTDDEVKSFDGWYHEMNDNLNEGGYDDDVKRSDSTGTEHDAWKAVHEKKLTILAGTEAGIINRFEAIPIVARGSSSLNGFKVENATKTYINLVGYGGIRFLRFNYNNGAWSNFVSEQGGNLSTLYATWTD